MNRFIKALPLNALFASKQLMSREDPYINHQFVVEIDGLLTFGFEEVSGLTNETEILEYQEGGQNRHTYKLAGQTKFGNITLKRGVIPFETSFFTRWRKKVTHTKMHSSLFNGSITLVGLKDLTTLYTIRSWMFFKAWPCKLEVDSFSSKGNEVTISTLELAVDRVTEIGI